jgi:hypothetical protein
MPRGLRLIFLENFHEVAEHMVYWSLQNSKQCRLGELMQAATQAGYQEEQQFDDDGRWTIFE